jgi:hypothetical protein
MSEGACLWCRSTFQPRASGGSRQRFCSPQCRRECHDCARRWAVAEIDAGRLSTAQLTSALKHSINAAVVGMMPVPAGRGADEQ